MAAELPLERAREALDTLLPPDAEGVLATVLHGLVAHAEDLERRVAELEARPGPDPRSAFIGG